MRRPRRNHTAAFKAKVAIAALKGDETLAALVEKFDVYPNQITQWKTQLLENASGVFATASENQSAGPDLKDMHAKTGQQALEIDLEAILKYGPPAIMNTDQGNQFASLAFIRVLEQNGIQISMDGKGCWRDNVFVERLWKSVKYEEVYLNGYDSVSVARQALNKYFDFCNRRRPHSTLDGMTPDTAYFTLRHPPLAAAA